MQIFVILAYGLNARLPGFARGHPPYAMSFETDGGIDFTNRGPLCRVEKVQITGFLRRGNKADSNSVQELIISSIGVY